MVSLSFDGGLSAAVGVLASAKELFVSARFRRNDIGFVSKLDDLVLKVFVGELLEKPNQPLLDVLSVWLPKGNNNDATVVRIQMRNGMIEISVRCEERCLMLLGQEENRVVVDASPAQLANVNDLMTGRSQRRPNGLRKALVNEEPHDVDS
jgi:hypothetical protein